MDDIVYLVDETLNAVRHWKNQPPTTYEGINQRISDVNAALETLRRAQRMAAVIKLESAHDSRRLSEIVDDNEWLFAELFSRDVIPWERLFMLEAEQSRLRGQMTDIQGTERSATILYNRLSEALDELEGWPETLRMLRDTFVGGALHRTQARAVQVLRAEGVSKDVVAVADEIRRQGAEAADDLLEALAEMVVHEGANIEELQQTSERLLTSLQEITSTMAAQTAEQGLHTALM